MYPQPDYKPYKDLNLVTLHILMACLHLTMLIIIGRSLAKPFLCNGLASISKHCAECTYYVISMYFKLVFQLTRGGDNLRLPSLQKLG